MIWGGGGMGRRGVGGVGGEGGEGWGSVNNEQPTINIMIEMECKLCSTYLSTQHSTWSNIM